MNSDQVLVIAGVIGILAWFGSFFVSAWNETKEDREQIKKLKMIEEINRRQHNDFLRGR